MFVAAHVDSAPAIRGQIVVPPTKDRTSIATLLNFRHYSIYILPVGTMLVVHCNTYIKFLGSQGVLFFSSQEEPGQAYSLAAFLSADQRQRGLKGFEGAVDPEWKDGSSYQGKGNPGDEGYSHVK